MVVVGGNVVDVVVDVDDVGVDVVDEAIATGTISVCEAAAQPPRTTAQSKAAPLIREATDTNLRYLRPDMARIR